VPNVVVRGTTGRHSRDRVDAARRAGEVLADLNSQANFLHPGRRSVGNGGEYFYFFCRGRQLKTCDAPYSSYDRVEDEIIRHYETIQFTPEFVASMRAELEATVADSTSSQQALAQQIKEQLNKLAAQEENLLDLAADGSLPTTKIRQRLRKIAEQRERLQAQETDVDAKLAEGAAHIEQCLQLLEDPAELYRHASDETRRQLNQAIFGRLYVYNDKITGHEMKEPLAEFLALEAGERVLQATGDAATAVDALRRAFGHHAPERSKTAPKGGLACLDAVLAAVTSSHGSSNDRLVELAGIEPASSSVEPGLLRVQSVMSLFLAPVLAQTRHRRAQSTRCPSCPADSGTR
jgi:site-specific DNA recombinase